RPRLGQPRPAPVRDADRPVRGARVHGVLPRAVDDGRDRRPGVVLLPAVRRAHQVDPGPLSAGRAPRGGEMTAKAGRGSSAPAVHGLRPADPPSPLAYCLWASTPLRPTASASRRSRWSTTICTTGAYVSNVPISLPAGSNFLIRWPPRRAA